jgi:hypothetical protein
MLQLETQVFTRGTTLIIVTASADAAWVGRAQRLLRRGIKPTVVLVDPSSFNSLVSSEEMRRALKGAGIPYLLVRKDDNLSTILQQRPS